MILGSTLVRFDCVTSTNDIARDLAAAGTEEGVAVVAGQQTAGRGSKGRSWSSPPGEGLYVSIVLRPQLAPSSCTVLTLFAAVAVAETISEEFAVAADIKWPNDVLLGGRKVCGILVETAIEGARLQWAVLGIGVNLLQQDFPSEMKDRATSVLIETGRSHSPDEFLPRLFERLERWYPLAVKSPLEVIVRYEQLSSFVNGCCVRVVAAQGSAEAEYHATTRGLTDGGALVVETEDGERRVVVSGEIYRIRRASKQTNPLEHL